MKTLEKRLQALERALSVLADAQGRVVVAVQQEDGMWSVDGQLMGWDAVKAIPDVSVLLPIVPAVPDVG